MKDFFLPILALVNMIGGMVLIFMGMVVQTQTHWDHDQFMLVYLICASAIVTQAVMLPLILLRYSESED